MNAFTRSVEEMKNVIDMDYNEYGRTESTIYEYQNDKFVCLKCDNGRDLSLDYSGSLNASGTITLEKAKVINLSFQGKEFTATYNNEVQVKKIDE